jgi:ParB-like chromosome segregation protein Spo0J
MSTIENLHKENLEFIKRRRNRQRVADLAGVHVNTISDLILDKRPNPSLGTVVAIEKAVATIKHNLRTF